MKRSFYNLKGSAKLVAVANCEYLMKISRQYCARRLRRLYKVLQFTQGTRNNVKPKKVSEDKLSDVR